MLPVVKSLASVGSFLKITVHLNLFLPVTIHSISGALLIYHVSTKSLCKKRSRPFINNHVSVTDPVKPYRVAMQSNLSNTDTDGTEQSIHIGQGCPY